MFHRLPLGRFCAAFGALAFSSVFAAQDGVPKGLPTSLHICNLLDGITVCGDIFWNGTGWEGHNDFGEPGVITINRFEGGVLRFSAIDGKGQVVGYDGVIDSSGKGTGQFNLKVNGQDRVGTWTCLPAHLTHISAAGTSPPFRMPIAFDICNTVSGSHDCWTASWDGRRFVAKNPTGVFGAISIHSFDAPNVRFSLLAARGKVAITYTGVFSRDGTVSGTLFGKYDLATIEGTWTSSGVDSLQPPSSGAPERLRLCTKQCFNLLWAADHYNAIPERANSICGLYTIVTSNDEEVVMQGHSAFLFDMTMDRVDVTIRGRPAEAGGILANAQMQWRRGVNTGDVPCELTWRITDMEAAPGEPHRRPVPETAEIAPTAPQRAGGGPKTRPIDLSGTWDFEPPPGNALPVMRFRIEQSGDAVKVFWPAPGGEKEMFEGKYTSDSSVTGNMISDSGTGDTETLTIENSEHARLTKGGNLVRSHQDYVAVGNIAAESHDALEFAAKYIREQEAGDMQAANAETLPEQLPLVIRHTYTGWMQRHGGIQGIQFRAVLYYPQKDGASVQGDILLRDGAKSPVLVDIIHSNKRWMLYQFTLTNPN